MDVSYCFTPSGVQAYVFCYGLVGLVGLLVGILELLNRYNAGNRASWVLLGWPQFSFYFINVIAALLTLFIAETSGATSLVANASGNFAATFVKCLEMGLAGMFVLRSRLISVTKKGSSGKVDIGPSQILNMVYRYLDRLTDQSRGMNAMNEVQAIMANFSGNLTDLTAVCLRIPEAIPATDIEKLKRTLDTINKNSKKLSVQAQGLLMGLELQREVGTATLKAAVASLANTTVTPAVTIDMSQATRAAPNESSEPGDVVSLDSVIEELVRKFEAGSGGASEERKDGDH